MCLTRQRPSHLSGLRYAATTARMPRELPSHSVVADRFRPHRRTSQRDSSTPTRQCAEPRQGAVIHLQSSGEGRGASKAGSLARPFPSYHYVTKWTIGAIEHKFAGAGQCVEHPTDHRSDRNDMRQAVLGAHARQFNRVGGNLIARELGISLRRAPDRIKSLINAPAAPPSSLAALGPSLTRGRCEEMFLTMANGL